MDTGTVLTSKVYFLTYQKTALNQIYCGSMLYEKIVNLSSALQHKVNSAKLKL